MCEDNGGGRKDSRENQISHVLVTVRPVLASSSPSLSGVCFKFSVIIKQLQASKSSRRAPASDCRPLLHRFPIVSSALHNLRISSQLYFVRREPESLLLPNPNGFPNLVLSKSIPKAWGESVEPEGRSRGNPGSEPAPAAPVKNPQLLNP